LMCGQLQCIGYAWISAWSVMRKQAIAVINRRLAPR
jgi:hypothetical protein